MRMIMRGAGAALLYLFLMVFPLVVGSIYDPITTARPFSLELAVAFGYVGLAIMAFQFCLVSRLTWASAAFGQDALQQFHRQMGFVATAFILLHPTLLFLNGFSIDTLLNPFNENPWALKWGTCSLYALLALVVLSIGRKRLRIPYEWWQWTHALLATAAVGGGLLHIYGIANYTGSWAMKGLWGIYTLGLLGLTLRYRLILPILRWRRPWEVVRNIPELGHSHTLVLKPIHHRGFSFEPGQFAWLMTGKSPFALEQHPISFSSAGDVPLGGEVAFTIKELGDWSIHRVPEIKPGTRLWLDGPYGVFSADREQGPGYVLIGGGVGITPLYSILRTMIERQDARPVILFYGSRDWKDVTFREEINALAASRANVKVIYVLEKPPPQWRGESGFITEEILRRNLPHGHERFQYFVCGPIPMMDVMEQLLPRVGVPADQIHTERFDMV